MGRRLSPYQAVSAFAALGWTAMLVYQKPSWGLPIFVIANLLALILIVVAPFIDRARKS